MVLVRDLANKVRIAEGFPALYEVPEGSDKVYYVDADRERGEIHFTVPTSRPEFESYHVSRVYSGKNVQIWYKKGELTTKWNGEQQVDNINIQGLPGREVAEFEQWYKTNRDNCNKAAADFWNKMNV